MRLSFSGRVAAALMLLALGGYATAQERLTLRIADQKGGMRSQLEAANALQNLPYDIKWAEFPAAAPLAEALAKRFGGRLGDLGALHHPNGEDQRGADPGERQRAAAGEYLPRGNGFRA